MTLERYLQERKKWKAAGKPVRSSERISEIHDICSKCPYFEKGNGHIPGYDLCGLCGCNLHKTSKKLNAIAYATKSCPDDPPQWVAEVPES